MPLTAQYEWPPAQGGQVTRIPEQAFHRDIVHGEEVVVYDERRSRDAFDPGLASAAVRILFWTDWFLPSIGGVEVFSARLLPDLARRGHEIVVVAGHHQAGLPDEIDWRGVRVCRFAFHSVLAAGDVSGIARTLTAVARLKQTLRPNLVHLNTLGPSVLFHLQTSGRYEAPVLLTMHSPVSEGVARRDTLHGRALRSAVHVNCNSHAVHRDLCRIVPEVAGHASVTYYGMDPPALTPSPRPRTAVVLGFGRLVHDKGFDLALRAVDLVRSRHPEIRFLLAGDGPSSVDLRALIEDLDLAPCVELLGRIDPERIPEILDGASLVVVPSRWNEPFGLVALEAALMARPVVATRVGGLAEVVEHQRTGLVVEPENVEALADAVLTLLDDPALADRLGVMARERALQRFSWKRCVDDYEALYTTTGRVEADGDAA